MTSLVQVPVTNTMVMVAPSNAMETDISPELTQNLVATNGHVSSPLHGDGFTGGLASGKRFLKQPQISVEQVETSSDSESNHQIESYKLTHTKSDLLCTSDINSNSGQQDKVHLQVELDSTKFYQKSASLPLGTILDRFSDRESQSFDSSAYNSSDISEEEDNGSHPINYLKPGMKRNEIVLKSPPQGGKKVVQVKNGLYDDDSSEMSSDDESEVTVPMMLPHVDPDDDVFREFGDIDICNEADTKLVDWSYNVFIPACRTLLLHCSESYNMEETPDQILADLRNLSNTISYFCSEQQRLSGQLRLNVKGISSSLSTDRFCKIKDKAKNLTICQADSKTSISSDSASSSGFGQDLQYDLSYAVKILRSVSQSLIAPLLHDFENGFTPDLYKSIVQAIQKIAWKVEACLSFNDPNNDFNIYAKIFDDEQKLRVTDMMIRALPPEEPKLKISASCKSESMSISSIEKSNKEDSLEANDVSRVVRRTPSGKVRPSGIIFDSDTLSPGIEETLEGGAAKLNHVESDIHHDKNWESCRPRMATIASPQRSNWRSFDYPTCREQDFDECAVEMPHYFRPKHCRRTTISLSRKEVTKLGLTVAEKVDESLASTTRRSRGPNSESDDIEVQMEKVKSRLHAVLTQQFEKDMEIRQRSASTSDLLDDNSDSKSRGKTRNLSCQEDENTLMKTQTSLDSPTLAENLERSYMPPVAISRQMSDTAAQNIEKDWVKIDPGTSLDSSIRKRAGTKNSKILLNKASGSHKASKAKNAVKKSLSASGRFTTKVLNTAKALRRGSISSISKSKRGNLLSSVAAGSMDKLTEETQKDLAGPRLTSLSEPHSPKFVTMPKQKKSTLARRDGPKQSKSLGSSGSLARRRKSSSKSGFLTSSAYTDSGNSALNESIYRLSNKAIQPSPMSGEEQLLLAVEHVSKVPSKAHKKRSSFISSSSSSIWYQVTVTTNMKQFGRNHYTILRTLKEVLVLYDTIVESYANFADTLPNKPNKKAALKVQKYQLEEFMRVMAHIPELRTADPFVLFLMPDDEFGNFSENSEINFELLMTFYTPNIYPGPPGSHNDIQVVSAEDVPIGPSPTRSRKHSSLQRGTLHVVKGKEGKDDNSTFVIREEGQDALIVACEGERYVVVAGTFEKLVEQLACEEKPDPRFVMTFLLGYRHFATTMELLSLLLRRFHMAVPPDATEEELSYAEKWRYVIQLRVLDVLTYWLKKCWPDFYRNSLVMDKVKEFIDQLKESHDTNFQLAGTNLEKVLKDKIDGSIQYGPKVKATGSLPTSPSSPFPTATSSVTVDSPLPSISDESLSGHQRLRKQTSCIDITAVSAIQLARQLTLIELEFLRAIDIHELVVYTWEPNSQGNKPYRKNIDAYISRFNKLSYWISSEVCTVQDAKMRGLLIEKFIDVAKYCQEYKNFNSTISIMSGLALAAVRRLKKSWEFVNEKSTKSFHKMSHIMSPSNNHNSYRKILSTVNRRDPCIPYFGVFMRDLIFFNDGNHKTLKNGLLNFSKLRSIVYKFEELKRYQRSKYFFPPEDKTQEFCRNLWCLSESDLYETSLQLEPREVLPPQVTESDV